MQSKIIARMFGGLGNQLFIYAMARAKAIHTNSQLYLDVESGFKIDPYKRFYMLDHFNIEAQKAGSVARFSFPGGKILRYIFRNYFTDILPGAHYFKEPDFTHYDSDSDKLKFSGYLWLEGYWQSPRYFEQFRQQLLTELALKSEMSEESRHLAIEIQQNNSICLHIRRLRNILVGEENASIKTLSLEYYQQAIRLMVSQIEKPVFYCFADDSEWLKENLHIPYPTIYVTHNRGDEKSHEDFWLMQQCRHFIISNSTFSWWAAWLSNAQDKLVLAPDLNFWDCKDVLPAEWQIVK